MNNKRILIVGVFAVIVTMMIGYALFSETITIKGAATAKGDFELTTICTSGISNEIAHSGISFATEGGYKNDSCSALDNVVTFDASLEYPGARRYFTIKIVNTGTIAATDESIDFTAANGKNCLYNASDDTLVRCLNPNGNDVTNSVTKFIKKDKNGNITELKNKDKVILESGDTFYIATSITWPAVFSSNTYKKGYYSLLTRNFILDFVQSTK